VVLPLQRPTSRADAATVALTDEPFAVPGGAWTRDDLRALATGKKVMVRDADAHPKPVPEWLAEVATPAEANAWEIDVAAIHPADRVALVRCWWAALAAPGQRLQTGYRVRDAEGVHDCHNDWINLLEDDELGIVILTEELGLISESLDWEEDAPEFTFDTMNWVVEHYDDQGIKIWVSGRIEEIYGRPAEAIVGQIGLDYLHPNEHAEVLALWMDLLAEPTTSRSTRLQVMRPDGSSVWVETTFINQLADERIGAIVCISHDITRQLEQEAQERVHADELRRSHEEFQTLADEVPAAVFRTDGRGRLTFLNRRFRELVGGDDEPFDNLLELVDEDGQAELIKSLRRLASRWGPDAEVTQVRSSDGTRLFSLSCRAVGAVGGDTVRPIVGSITDVTADAELRHEAEHDILTGLFNRREIDRRLDAAIADETEVLVGFVDLDGFKAVNDTSGHDAGDAVLQEIGRRLRRAVRPTDDVGRYGGDEFVLICRNATQGAEEIVAGRIRHALAEPIVFAGGEWQPAASVGMARRLAGEHASSVLKRADEAMYANKRTDAPR